MNNSSTDTSKTTAQQPSFVKKVEANDDARPTKVDEPKPSSDTDRKAGETKQATDDDASGKSLR